MIIDQITQIEQYRGIPCLNAVIDYLMQTDVGALPPGKTEIDGERLFVNIQVYETREEAEVKPEAHDRYVDLQMVLEGEEYIGLADRSSLGEPCDDPPGDIVFYDAPFSKMLFRPGTFGIFFPNDAHAPCISVHDRTIVKKAVFKILIEA